MGMIDEFQRIEHSYWSNVRKPSAVSALRGLRVDMLHPPRAMIVLRSLYGNRPTRRYTRRLNRRARANGYDTHAAMVAAAIQMAELEQRKMGLRK